jgi:antitoxin PrlF
MLAESRLTQKYQATIPLEIRRLLNVTQGDTLAFDLHEGHVVVRKQQPLDKTYARQVEAGLTEWASDIDDEDYHDL